MSYVASIRLCDCLFSIAFMASFFCKWVEEASLQMLKVNTWSLSGSSNCFVLVEFGIFSDIYICIYIYTFN